MMRIISEHEEGNQSTAVITALSCTHYSYIVKPIVHLFKQHNFVVSGQQAAR